MLPAPMKPILLHMLRSSRDEKNRTPSAGARAFRVSTGAMRALAQMRKRANARARTPCARARRTHARLPRVLLVATVPSAPSARRPTPANIPVHTGASRRSVCEYAHEQSVERQGTTHAQHTPTARAGAAPAPRGGPATRLRARYPSRSLTAVLHKHSPKMLEQPPIGCTEGFPLRFSKVGRKKSQSRNRDRFERQRTGPG